MHVVTSNGIGERIREAREAQGMKRVQLAVAADLAPNTIRNYEDGWTPGESIDVGNLRAIAEALGVELVWLIEGKAVA